MDIQPLKDLGLTDAESKIYIALVSLGCVSVGKIIKKTGLHKATVYQSLEKMLEKGFVSYINEGRIKKFQAINPEFLIEHFKEKEENFRKILPQLLEKRNEIKTNAEIFSGRKGIISIYRDILNYKEYYNLGAGIPIVEVLGDFFYQFQNQKEKKKIISKILLSENVRDNIIRKNIFGEYRYLPKELEAPVNTIIYGNKIAVISWKDLIGFVFESKETSEVYRKYFDLLWKMAKKN